MAKKKPEKKYKICVSVTKPTGRGRKTRWVKTCKEMTKRQIAKLVGPIGKGMDIREVSIF